MKAKTTIVLLSKLMMAAAWGLPLAGCGSPVTFVITDEQHRPIEGANILVVYRKGWMPGEGFGRDLYASKEKTTDKNGMAHFRISPYGLPRFDYEVEDPKGRYHPSIRTEEAHLSKEGTTQVGITLRAKRNPIPLLLPRFYSFYFPKVDGKAVSLREPVGFDAVIGDWLPPYGKGKVVDFIFRSRYQEWGPREEIGIHGVTVTHRDFKYSAAFSWTFANADDGIVEAPRHWPTSVLPVEREAPVEGYLKEFRMEWHRPKRPSDFEKDEKRQHFFRIRTQRDREGKIVYALYGKLLREPLFGDLRFEDCQFFYYCLNLTPMDRNLEYNGENLDEQTALRTHATADYVRRFPAVLLKQSEHLRALPPLAEEDREKDAPPSPPDNAL